MFNVKVQCRVFKNTSYIHYLLQVRINDRRCSRVKQVSQAIVKTLLVAVTVVLCWLASFGQNCGLDVSRTI